MERPLVQMLLVGALLAILASFTTLMYVQSQNFTTAARQASATSVTYAIAGAVASAVADARTAGVPVSSALIFNQPISVAAAGRTVTASLGGSGSPVNSTVTLTAAVNIAATSIAAMALNITAYPNGTVIIVRA